MREYLFPEDRHGCHFIGALAGVAGGLVGGGGGGGGGGLVSGIAGAAAGPAKSTTTTSDQANVANINIGDSALGQQGQNRNFLGREGSIENGGQGNIFPAPFFSFLPGVAPPSRGVSGAVGALSQPTVLIPILLAAVVAAFFIFRRRR